jgi:uncharacterized membrane protein
MLLLLLPLIDTQKRNYEDFQAPFGIVRTALTLFLGGIYASQLAIMRQVSLNMTQAVCAMAGILFTALGLVMGKFKRNWFAGLRTPWTLSSELSWNKSNRLAGRLFVATGLLTTLTAFLSQKFALLLLISGLLVSSLVSAVYSYFVWKRDPARDR